MSFLSSFFQFSKLKNKTKFLKGRKHLEKTYNLKPNSHIQWFTCYKITPVLISHLFSPFHTCITTIALRVKRSPTDAWGYSMRDVSRCSTFHIKRGSVLNQIQGEVICPPKESTVPIPNHCSALCKHPQPKGIRKSGPGCRDRKLQCHTVLTNTFPIMS